MTTGIIYYVYVDWKRVSIRSSPSIFDPPIIVTVCGVNFVSGNLGNRKSYDVKLRFSKSRSSGALGEVYKNEVSNSCAIQKELNRLFGQVNFVPGKLGNRNSYNGKL